MNLVSSCAKQQREREKAAKSLGRNRASEKTRRLLVSLRVIDSALGEFDFGFRRLPKDSQEIKFTARSPLWVVFLRLLLEMGVHTASLWRSQPKCVSTPAARLKNLNQKSFREWEKIVCQLSQKYSLWYYNNELYFWSLNGNLQLQNWKAFAVSLWTVKYQIQNSIYINIYYFFSNWHSTRKYSFAVT
jgi:hypothetical protein